MEEISDTTHHAHRKDTICGQWCLAWIHVGLILFLFINLTTFCLAPLANTSSYQIKTQPGGSSNTSTVELPLRGYNRDQEIRSVSFNRGDNYKDYISVLPAETRTSVALMEVSQISGGSTVVASCYGNRVSSGRVG